MGDVDRDLNANSGCRSTGDPQLDAAVQRWLSWDKVSVCSAVCAAACGRASARSSAPNHPAKHHERPLTVGTNNEMLRNFIYFVETLRAVSSLLRSCAVKEAQD